eukprot:GHVL01020332.1.p1 GENE.GHVL01020332.1~~GHVL01020332.1.p1  ORF type:complete len:397 (+),score=54.96 GHVL01020332.1:1317-2507(+)
MSHITYRSKDRIISFVGKNAEETLKMGYCSGPDWCLRRIEKLNQDLVLVTDNLHLNPAYSRLISVFDTKKNFSVAVISCEYPILTTVEWRRITKKDASQCYSFHVLMGVRDDLKRLPPTVFQEQNLSPPNHLITNPLKAFQSDIVFDLIQKLASSNDDCIFLWGKITVNLGATCLSDVLNVTLELARSQMGLAASPIRKCLPYKDRVWEVYVQGYRKERSVIDILKMQTPVSCQWKMSLTDLTFSAEGIRRSSFLATVIEELTDYANYAKEYNIWLKLVIEQALVDDNATVWLKLLNMLTDFNIVGFHVDCSKPDILDGSWMKLLSKQIAHKTSLQRLFLRFENHDPQAETYLKDLINNIEGSKSITYAKLFFNGVLYVDSSRHGEPHKAKVKSEL